MQRDESKEFLLLDSDGATPYAHDRDLTTRNQAV
jgi:hypothetical protein